MARNIAKVGDKYVFLYFAVEADNDNIKASGSGHSHYCVPAGNLMEIAPSSDSLIKYRFDPLYHDVEPTSGSSKPKPTETDSVELELATNNTHFDAARIIMGKINNDRVNFDGFIDVVDSMTTIIGGGAGSRGADAIGDGSAESSVISKLYKKDSTNNVITSKFTATSFSKTNELPDIGTGGAAPTAIAAGALTVNTAYTNAETAAKNYTIPSCAAGDIGDWITVTYIADIGNGNLHSYHSTTDTQFALGSMVRVVGEDATRVAVVDVSVADDDEVKITGLTNGDGGIGTTLRFVNTTGAANGWAVDCVVQGQGAKSAASATTVFAA